MLARATITSRASAGGLPVRAHPCSSIAPEQVPTNVLDCEYAVRGAVPIRAEELAKKLNAGENMKFEKLVSCNIGNPQAVGGKPLSYHRQVVACLIEPSLLEQEGLFPEDVRAVARHYLKGIAGAGMGAYSHSKGHAVFRDDIAEFLTNRDGIPTSAEDVFLTDGASVGVKSVLQLLIRGPKDGILLPIPQYPLYSASITLLGGRSVGYYLNEDAGWSIEISELERAVKDFRAEGGTPRAIAVINPGNPSGAVLSREAMTELLQFAEREKLAVLADEVYQDNVHVDNKEFIPFRKLAHELGITTEVFSFHSTSKGVTGECGLRGGFLHLQNVNGAVSDQIYKLQSICLCSNTLGQALMASVVKLPPVDGPSRAQFDAERNTVYAAYKRKAKMVTDRLNAIDGISCQPIEGAMYAFPQVDIKGYVMKKAISLGAPADSVYCLELLERTGVVTVPGSGFGQRPGTFHFRMTILPDEETLSDSLDRIEKFHREHEAGWVDDETVTIVNKSPELDETVTIVNKSPELHLIDHVHQTLDLGSQYIYSNL